MSAPNDDYRRRFRRVLDYIETHLDQDLSLEMVSSVAAYSKHHFHRQFCALFGLSVHKYLQLLRTRRAGYELAFRDTRILDVAFTSGYESNEAFTRAFKASVGQTPSKFRATPHWQRWQTLQNTLAVVRSKYMKPEHRVEDVTVVAFPETRVAALEHRGTVTNLGATIRSFIDWRRRNRLPPKLSATFNIQHGSHPDVADGDYHVDVCAATNAPVDPNPEGVIAKSIPAGRCALIRHHGSDDTLAATVTFLYATWLPASGEEPRDYPLFFQRVQFFPDVAEHDAVTDVFLPIR